MWIISEHRNRQTLPSDVQGGTVHLRLGAYPSTPPVFWMVHNHPGHILHLRESGHGEVPVNIAMGDHKSKKKAGF